MGSDRWLFGRLNGWMVGWLASWWRGGSNRHAYIYMYMHICEYVRVCIQTERGKETDLTEYETLVGARNMRH
jgi:hypothetical protein